VPVVTPIEELQIEHRPSTVAAPPQLDESGPQTAQGTLRVHGPDPHGVAAGCRRAFAEYDFGTRCPAWVADSRRSGQQHVLPDWRGKTAGAQDIALKAWQRINLCGTWRRQRQHSAV